MILGHHINSLSKPGFAWPATINPTNTKIVRFAAGMHWHLIEKSPGVYDWTAIDAMFAKLPLGVKVIAAQSGTPVFYSARPTEPGNAVFPTGTLAEPADYTNLQNYWTAFLTRYAPRVYGIEGPNEPGVGSAYFSGDSTAILESQRATYRPTLGFPGVECISATVVLDDRGFASLSALMNTQAMTKIGVHFYASKYDITELRYTLYRLQDLLARSGANAKKRVIITEFGFNAPPHGLLNFRDLPAPAQIALLQSYLAVVHEFDMDAIYFAVDDPMSYGFLGRPDVEAAFSSMQVKYA